MGLKEDLKSEVAKIFKEAWTERDGLQVPEPDLLRLVKLDAVVLYADMSDSTKLVDGYKAWFAAEIYKAYLTCAARIIKQQNGTITAYDGDRVMAIFIGSRKTAMQLAGLKINSAVIDIINPAIALQFPTVAFRLSHVVGIDASSLFAARIGIRKYNDIVWVGKAANYAAKMAGIKNPNNIFISDTVFSHLRDDVKFGGKPRRLVWETCQWTQMGNMALHRSNWKWQI